MMTANTLRGTIERITYHNEENGYSVVQLLPEGQASTVTVVGNMLGINVGESVALTGAWVAHSQYGRQFKADTMQTVQRADQGHWAGYRKAHRAQVRRGDPDGHRAGAGAAAGGVGHRPQAR